MEQQRSEGIHDPKSRLIELKGVERKPKPKPWRKFLKQEAEALNIYDKLSDSNRIWWIPKIEAKFIASLRAWALSTRGDEAQKEPKVDWGTEPNRDGPREMKECMFWGFRVGLT
ncbi:hypothetical protein RJT34_15746 [Clitoria ternatea]|uniref:Uncharacterized protein n=1 Tax=Clitoria ternatea TaxID=43366 RepID=A0AAN9J604_CLITE